MRSTQAITTARLTETTKQGSSSKQETQQSILTALIIAASCVRVLVCLQHNPMDYLWSDPLRHWMNGARFPHGGYFGASDPIGYQVYIFLLRGITRDNRILVALACALLSIVMPWIYYRAARSLGLQKIPAPGACGLLSPGRHHCSRSISYDRDGDLVAARDYAAVSFTG